MATRRVKKLVRVAAVSGVFAAGFLCGTLSQPAADAQTGGLGEAVMKQAGESGGTLGAAAQLGSSLIEMQQHVTALQKNIDTLSKVKAALGG